MVLEWCLMLISSITHHGVILWCIFRQESIMIQFKQEFKIKLLYSYLICWLKSFWFLDTDLNSACSQCDWSKVYPWPKGNTSIRFNCLSIRPKMWLERNKVDKMLFVKISSTSFNIPGFNNHFLPIVSLFTARQFLEDHRKYRYLFLVCYSVLCFCCACEKLNT